MAGSADPSKLLDIRGLGKPPNFTGEESQFVEWKFRFEISMSLMGLADNMKTAEARNTEITIEEMSEAALQKSKTLYAILAQVLSGKALALIRLVPNHNGFESWRLIAKEFQPDSNIRTSRMLSGALNPRFSQNLNQFGKELLEWELLVQRYDAQSGTPLQDHIKIAIMVGHSPPVIQQWLMHTEEFEFYSDLRIGILKFISRHSQFDDHGSIISPGTQTRSGSGSQSTSMEVDLNYIGGKGKGKGEKGKYGGKHSKGQYGGKGYQNPGYYQKGYQNPGYQSQGYQSQGYYQNPGYYQKGYQSYGQKGKGKNNDYKGS